MDDASSFRSCHQILGIDRDATGDEVAMAYLRTALRYHPAARIPEGARGQARVQFREAAEAWAVLSDGRVESCRGADGDARALAVFDETLVWRAGELARRGLRTESILEALLAEGCPQPVAWAAAQVATGEAPPGTVLSPPPAPPPLPTVPVVPVLAASPVLSAALGATPPSEPAPTRARTTARAWSSSSSAPSSWSTLSMSLEQPSAPEPADAPAAPALDPDVPVLAAAKAAAAEINKEQRRVSLAAARHAAPAPAPDFAGVPGGASAARPAPGPQPAAPRRAASTASARPGVRGPAARGAGRPGEDPDAPYDPFPDLDARIEERVAAFVADLSMVVIAFVLPAIALGWALGWSQLALERVALGALLVGAAVWFVAGEVAWRATPGKKLLGLSVERLDDAPLDAGVVCARHGVRTMTVLLGGLGFAAVAITERRQALHDLLTATRVRSRGIGRQDFVRGLCAVPLVLAVGAFALSRLGG